MKAVVRSKYGSPGVLSIKEVAITGSDFAGQIVSVGKNVKSFKTDDKVMGFGGAFECGSHAQYFTLPETKPIVIIPGNINYDQAAACIEGASYIAEAFKYVATGQKTGNVIITMDA